MIPVPMRRDGETEGDYMRRKEAAWGLWQSDALERMRQQDQTIEALQARVRELSATLESIKGAAQQLAAAAIDGLAEMSPDDIGRDLCGHINLMGALGDPDYRRGQLSCRHIDTRTTKPRAPRKGVKS